VLLSRENFKGSFFTANGVTKGVISAGFTVSVLTVSVCCVSTGTGLDGKNMS